MVRVEAVHESRESSIDGGDSTAMWSQPSSNRCNCLCSPRHKVTLPIYGALYFCFYLTSLFHSSQACQRFKQNYSNSMLRTHRLSPSHQLILDLDLIRKITMTLTLWRRGCYFNALSLVLILFCQFRCCALWGLEYNFDAVFRSWRRGCWAVSKEVERWSPTSSAEQYQMRLRVTGLVWQFTVARAKADCLSGKYLEERVRR